jgi:cleavage and polyadenylation specificity factor subunit 1
MSEGAGLTRATLLAHLHPSTLLTLVMDASASAMGAVVQRRVGGSRRPLAFSKRLSPAQQGSSAYDGGLLAVCEAVKHSRHMLEARHFIVFADHRPITCVFQRRRDGCSPRQFSHLDFISQFTTDIKHISERDCVVAGALSHVESVTAPPSCKSSPHRKTATSFERPCGQRPPCGWGSGRGSWSVYSA